MEARRAAVHAAGPGVPSRLLSDCLGVGTRTVQSLRTQVGEPTLIGAVQKQALLRKALTRSTTVPQMP